MRYDWACQNCAATTEVERSFADSHRGPRHPCKRCGASDYKKKMNVPYLSGARSEKSPFPMRVRHLEQIVHVRDDKGRIIGTKRDPVVFQNEHQYNEHLSRKGLVKMMDGEDPSLGPSQKSVYDFVDTAAPTPKAEWLASQAFFTEDLSSVGELK